MKFEDAIKKSIKAFIAGKAPVALNEQRGEPVFFSPEYFDEMEAMFIEDDAPKKKKKAKKETVDGNDV